jgi:hypothetical protein
VKRGEFEHTIRAAGAILGVSDVLVIGSQAIHASVDVVIPEAQRSIETDISAIKDDDGSKADLIDGSIGELSAFQEAFGYYAQGVTPKTAILPDGWRKRLIRFRTPATKGRFSGQFEVVQLWKEELKPRRKSKCNRGATPGNTRQTSFCRGQAVGNRGLTP